jgi:hypothetical protein
MTRHPRRRLARFALLTGVIAGAMLWPAQASAQTAPFKIDHFWCYITTDQPKNVPVLLQDQFDRAFNPPIVENVTVWRPVRFCNPVQKIRLDTGQVTPIQNRLSHLKLYRMFVDDLDLAPTRQVKITNQFGTKTIKVVHQEVLAVPTEKNNEGAFHDLDHFKCYRATGGNINKFVTLTDQFQTQQGIKVLYPFGFCNPTRKSHGGIITPITNEEDHLTCYKVTRRPFTRTVQTRNQFGIETLILREPDLLCVPTKKLNVKVLA